MSDDVRVGRDGPLEALDVGADLYDDEIPTIDEIDPGRPPAEAVDLGDVGDLTSDRTLARRRAEEAASDTGIPMIGAMEEPEEDPDASLLAKAKRIVDSYTALRHTPYGLMPAMTIAMITFFGQFEASAYSIASPDIIEDLEIEVQTIINIGIFLSFISLFLSIPWGWWLDRHTRAPWIGIGSIASGISGIASSRANSIVQLGVPRVSAQVIQIGASVPGFSLLADYYPPSARGKVYALLGTLARAGALIAVFVAGAMVTLFGWRTAVLVLAIPSVLIGIYGIVKLREPVRGYMERKAMGADEEVANTEDEKLSFAEGWRATFGIRTLRRLFLADALSSGGDQLVALYAFLFIADQYGLRGIELSIFSIPATAAALVGGIVGGQVIDRLISKNPGRVLTVIGLYSIIAAFGVLGYVFAPPLVLLVLFSVILGFGRALIGPALGSVYSLVIPPNIRTQAGQITGLAQVPGLILFAPVAATLFNEYGFRTVFIVAFPFLVLGGIVATTAGSTFDLDARAAMASAVAAEEWRRAKSSGKSKLLVCRDVSVEYNGVQVLFGVDFDVEEGEIIALLGTNGAGKSTLLRAISGITTASGGGVIFDGRDITYMPPHEVAGRGVVQMPGGRGIFPELSVRENLLLGLWMVDDVAEQQARLAEVIEVFPSLARRLDAEARVLSGGEQQQLSLAQAFLAKPRLLLIDELSLGLAPAVVAELLEIVREIHRRGVTIVVVEQSVNVALTIADKAVFMEKGEVRFFGPTAELLERPDILRAVYVKGSGALSTGGPRGAQRSSKEQRALALQDARPVLEVDSLVKRYGGVTAVNGASFSLREGEVLGLIGPNGAGKTTLFELISGYQIPDEGTVRYEGVDITRLPPEQRAQKGLIRRFQDARLFGSLTVFETLLVALDKQLEAKSAVMSAFGMPQTRRAEKRAKVAAERLIELFELGAFRDKFVKELSTGLRRIVDMACVLASEPNVLLLDEPSSGIAQAEAESLGPLLRRAQHETGCSILIIEHDMPLISTVSDELLCLVQGSPLVRGTPDEVLNDERVIEAYLGGNEATVKRSGSIT